MRKNSFAWNWFVFSARSLRHCANRRLQEGEENLRAGPQVATETDASDGLPATQAGGELGSKSSQLLNGDGLALNWDSCRQRSSRDLRRIARFSGSSCAIRAIPTAFSTRRSMSTQRRTHSAKSQIRVRMRIPLKKPRIASVLEDVTSKSESQ